MYIFMFIFMYICIYMYNFLNDAYSRGVLDRGVALIPLLCLVYNAMYLLIFPLSVFLDIGLLKLCLFE